MPVEAWSDPRKELNEYVMSDLKPWDKKAFNKREEIPVEFESWLMVGTLGMRSFESCLVKTVFFCIKMSSKRVITIKFPRRVEWPFGGCVAGI